MLIQDMVLVRVKMFDPHSKSEEEIEKLSILLTQMDHQFRVAENLELVSKETLEEWFMQILLVKKDLYSFNTFAKI